MNNNIKRDFKDLKSKLQLIKVDSPTRVILLIVHKDESKNDITRLNCRNLIPLSGYPVGSKNIPVGGYVYDAVNDSYLVNCIDFFNVGTIPFSYKIKLDNVGVWTVHVPLPEIIITRYLAEEDLRSLNMFKSYYCYEHEFDFNFIQFITC